MADYQNLNDAELISLLFTQYAHLQMEVVDGFIRQEEATDA